MVKYLNKGILKYFRYFTVKAVIAKLQGWSPCSRSTTARLREASAVAPAKASPPTAASALALIQQASANAAISPLRSLASTSARTESFGCGASLSDGRPLEERRAGQACPRVPAVERRAPRETRFTTPSSSRHFALHYTKWPPFCFCSHFYHGISLKLFFRL